MTIGFIAHIQLLSTTWTLTYTTVTLPGKHRYEQKIVGGKIIHELQKCTQF